MFAFAHVIDNNKTTWTRTVDSETQKSLVDSPLEEMVQSETLTICPNLFSFVHSNLLHIQAYTLLYLGYNLDQFFYIIIITFF